MRFCLLSLLVLMSCRQIQNTACVNNTDTNMLPYAVPADLTHPIIFATDTAFAQKLIAFAKTLLGTPYHYASSDPRAGFDCSGFITYVFSHFHIAVPRSSVEFTNFGTEIPLQQCIPGDLILFTGTDMNSSAVGHMGIIVTNNADSISFIHSTSGAEYCVTITRLDDYYMSRFVKVIRVLK